MSGCCDMPISSSTWRGRTPSRQSTATSRIWESRTAGATEIGATCGPMRASRAESRPRKRPWRRAPSSQELVAGGEGWAGGGPRGDQGVRPIRLGEEYANEGRIVWGGVGMIIREASESVPRHMVHAGRPHPVARDEVLGLHSLPRLPGPFVNYNELTNDFAAHPGRSHSDSAEQHGFEQSAFSELPGKIVSR